MAETKEGRPHHEAATREVDETTWSLHPAADVTSRGWRRVAVERGPGSDPWGRYAWQRVS